MSLCGPNDCCLRDTNEIDMTVKTGAKGPGMQTGDMGLPEPAPRGRQQEVPVVIPPPPAKKDEFGQVFVMEIEKTPTMTKVGLDVDHGDEQTLEVMLVKDGLVQIYNEKAAENRKIKVGDRITEVNGVTGDNRKMLETVGRESKLRFVIKPCSRD